MKIAFINGSPRKNSGISAKLLHALEERLPGCEIVRGWGEPCDVYLFAFPLYVDGIPSNLLRELAEHETGLPPGARVYALVNNGFYEGGQNATAIAMLRNWSARAGLSWKQGAGIGGGPILESMSLPLGRGPLKNLGMALDTLAANILSGQSGESVYTRPGLPRWGYMLGGDVSFRAAAKKNGLSRRDIKRRL